jgi:hypothetical protein
MSPRLLPGSLEDAIVTRVARRIAHGLYVRRGVPALVLVLLTATMAGGASGGALAEGPPRPDPAGTVWLCRPDLHEDPCRSSLDAAVFSSPGAVRSLGRLRQELPGSATGAGSEEAFAIRLLLRYLPVCSRAGQVGCVIAYSAFPSRPRPTASSDGRARGSAATRVSSGPEDSTSRASTRRRSPVEQASSFPTFRQGCPWRPASGAGPRALSLGSMAQLRGPPDGHLPARRRGDLAPGISNRCVGGQARCAHEAEQWPAVGYHTIDVNIALGNLVQAVRDQEAKYR